ncbi:GNAT family N-acetyltransferase [Ktedonosporobacter rubrisoli]|uniref:GNAT family N-acetyltransferase n=1 Tax=Ktedonosporobacter rubrisoli TaxID=2509675 RepID=A0A4P6K2U7_KTERU|nr:GNAT family N-acetyltransferase [Ktedonosporobacter rubrisoli]QBD82040.1 GNAT family N-acetyltransferase [Ktedonosporobacter rubrisoli]
MSKIFKNLADPELPAAAEANLSGEMACFGQGLAGAELHEDAELLWFYTGRPYLNGVLISHFLDEDPAYVDRRINETLDLFKARKVDFIGWSIGPSTRPAHLARQLEAHGFTYADKTIGMVADIQAIGEEPVQLPPTFEIKEAEDAETLKNLRAIEIQGFDSKPEKAQNYYECYVSIGFGAGKQWHHYLGWQDGVPVAMGSLFLHAGVAGIYGIATIPEARRKGYGTIMTQHILHEIRKLGYRIAVLSPTEMSENIYRRLGFQDYCTIRHYDRSLF